MFSLLIMSSVPAPARSPSDLTARARIRDAAIARFGADGVASTTVRAIAADAGVSPALVIHHFGTKEGLRDACDTHTVATIREAKLAAMDAGPDLDMLAALRQSEDHLVLMRYLARTLADGSPAVGRLVDELVDDTVEYLERGVASGVLRPGDDPRGRAVVLTIWSLGALVLHEHVHRLLGADLTSTTEGLVAYGLPAAELLSQGLLAEGVHERLREQLTREEETS